MNLKLLAIAMPLLLASGCSERMTDEQKIKMLEETRLGILADLQRQQAECAAQAIEFSSSPMRDRVVSSCTDGFRMILDASRVTLADIDRRIAELQPSRPPITQHDGKLYGDR